jgi:hypothetical protein
MAHGTQNWVAVKTCIYAYTHIVLWQVLLSTTMSKHLLILGGGTAGTMMANHLRRRLPARSGA